MAVKRTGLGRGLDALIRDPKAKTSSEEKSETKVQTTKKNTKAAENKEKISKQAGKSTEKTVKSETSELQATSKSTSKAAKKTETKAAAKPASRTRTAEKQVTEKKTVQKKTTTAPTAEADSEKKPSLPEKGEATVRISLVEPNREQPRKTFDEASVSELADSIRQFGVITPLIVQKKNDHYEIVAGERRWRAAKEAGLKEIPVIIRDYDSQQAAEIALIENIQREDLNPMEEASAYRKLMDEFSLSQEEVAQKVSKSRTAVTNSMRLLKLDQRVQEMVKEGRLSEGHARTLLGIADGEEQFAAAEKIINERLSVRQTEQLVKKYGTAPSVKKKEVNPQWEAVAGEISEKLKNVFGTKVSINQKTRKKGTIEIEYYSNDDLERIYEMLLSVKD